jgi:hypothetical protein
MILGPPRPAPILDISPANAIEKGVANGDDGFRVGVYGSSVTNQGVFAESAQGVGILAKGGRLAGRFEGNVEVTGDIQLVNADCAEEFDVVATELFEPGTVMVLGAGGALRSSHVPYDGAVVGIISGAVTFKPALVLDRQSSKPHREPIALLGKVFCKVDADFAAIAVGDLLTTSATPGHAMKATDPVKAFGAVLGKALAPLDRGRALIPILVTLQ